MQIKSARQILQEALLRDFENRATHAAYADLLMEENDPRGEFIQLQCAQEWGDLQGREAERSHQRASELLFAHEREWLGSVADILMPPRQSGRVDPVEPNCTFGWRRGWIGTLRVHTLTPILIERFAQADELRMISRLEVNENRHDLYRWADRFPHLVNLICGNPYETMSTFEGAMILPMIRRAWPRLEQLVLLATGVDTSRLFAMPLPQLVELNVRFTTHYPIELLAVNDSLRQLQRLSLDPQGIYNSDELPNPPEEIRAFCRATHWDRLDELRMRLPHTGDHWVRELIASGLIYKLSLLDLCSTNLTDEGGQMLLEVAPQLKLRQLDLQGNHLSFGMTEELSDLYFRVHANYQINLELFGDETNDVTAPTLPTEED